MVIHVEKTVEVVLRINVLNLLSLLVRCNALEVDFMSTLFKTFFLLNDGFIIKNL